MNYEIDPIDWFTERCVFYKPNHFVASDVAITSESIEWIYKTLRGRFCLNTNVKLDIYNPKALYPAFEDPAEATAYELTWG